MCYTPKFLWDAFEGGLLRTIVMGLNVGICDKKEKKKKKEIIIGYLIRHESVSLFFGYLKPSTATVVYSIPVYCTV